MTILQKKLENAKAKTALFSMGFFTNPCITLLCNDEPYFLCSNGACELHCVCRLDLAEYEKKQVLLKRFGPCVICNNPCLPNRLVCDDHRSYQSKSKQYEKHVPGEVKKIKIGRRRKSNANSLIEKPYNKMVQILLERTASGEIIGRRVIPVKDLLKKGEYGISERIILKQDRTFKPKFNGGKLVT